MASLIYRCPATGLNVQGWIADDGSADDAQTYRALRCIACRQMHLVNPSTGKVLSGEEE